MASLVEIQELKLHHQHHMFSDPSDLQVFEELLMGDMELPTPPLSPDHADSSTSNGSSPVESTTLTTQEELDVGETILQQMMDSENLMFDSQSTCVSDVSDSSDILDVDPSVLVSLSGNPQALLQDCMWNCDAYEPRHSISCNGIYTPAPSPPPEVKDAIEEDEQVSTFDSSSRVHPQATTSESGKGTCASLQLH